jgi:hypothetical protein
LLEQGGKTYLAISFTPNPRATDVTFSGDFSPDLETGNWQAGALTPLQSGPPMVLGWPLTPPNAAGFVRLRIEVQP